MAEDAGGMYMIQVHRGAYSAHKHLYTAAGENKIEYKDILITKTKRININSIPLWGQGCEGVTAYEV